MSDLFDTSETDEAPPELEFLNDEGIEKRRSRRILMVSLISLVAIAAIVILAYIFIKILPASSKPNIKHPAKGRVAATANPKINYKNSMQTNEVSQTASDKRIESAEATSSSPANSPVIKQMLNVLIVGIDDSDGTKQAKGLMLAKIDILNGVIQGVNIPDKTYLNVNGLGLDKISAAYTKGLDLAKQTVEDLFQVKADGYITLHYPDFEYMVGGGRFQVAFDRAIDSNFSSDEKKSYSKEIAGIDTSKVNVVQLPVKFISINGEPYYEPNYGDMSHLVESVWGIKLDVKTETTRVLIINGSGQPGVGRAVSDKLNAGGFIIVNIKNASNFSYKKTTIIVYKEDYMEKAKMIQRIIGTGDVVYHPVTQDIAEIAVIVGPDFKVN